MQPKSNQIYTLKDEFFEKYPDPHLKYNKREKRPHYFAFKSKQDEEIIWMIPMSSKTDKYERFIKNRESKGKPTDMAYVCEVGGEKSAFAIADMFPTTERYLKKEFKMNGEPLKIVDDEDIKILNSKAATIHELIQGNVKFTSRQVDAKGIEKQLLQELKEERKQNNTLRTSADKHSEGWDKTSQKNDAKRKQQLERMRSLER